jgi:hypothetical protein
MEMQQTHCYATGTVTLLWKRYQGPNMSHYYGNAIKDLTCHYIYILFFKFVYIDGINITMFGGVY